MRDVRAQVTVILPPFRFIKSKSGSWLRGACRCFRKNTGKKHQTILSKSRQVLKLTVHRQSCLCTFVNAQRSQTVICMRLVSARRLVSVVPLRLPSCAQLSRRRPKSKQERPTAHQARHRRSPHLPTGKTQPAYAQLRGVLPFPMLRATQTKRIRPTTQPLDEMLAKPRGVERHLCRLRAATSGVW